MSTSDATTLKAEGIALYIAKDYPAAYVKYDAAIELDGENTVLYANRGACSFAMNKFMDAAADCTRATELDPKYMKAWARLGASLQNIGQYSGAIPAYESALKTLPATAGMTPTDHNLKQQCEDGLREVRVKMSRGADLIVAGEDLKEDMPWKRAEKMEEELFKKTTVEETISSAWVISEAYRDFKSGVDIINTVRKVPGKDGQFGILGKNGGLTYLTNAIIRDPRVFHIDEPDTFIEKYDLNVEMEVQRDKAWPPSAGGAQHIIDKALELQQSGGWDAVRPALATTIRIWIMKGFVEQSIANNPASSLEYYSRAVDVLEWGRRVWRDVPAAQRGTIFADTFLAGVKNLRIESLMLAYTQDKSKIPLDSLYEDANDLVEAVKNLEEPLETEPGFVLSFFVYPKAHAYAIIGLYYRELAEANDGNDEKAVHECYHHAGEAYMKAGMFYPKDDENYCYYLICALEMLYLCKGTAEAFLRIMERVRLAESDMKMIWEHFVMAEIRDEKIRQTLQAEKDLRNLIASGEFTTTSIVAGELPPV